jgi:hypothetical protein
VSESDNIDKNRLVFGPCKHQYKYTSTFEECSTGTRPPGWGAPPMFPTHPGRGGSWGNVSPRPPFGETRGDAGGVFPQCGGRFPKRGAFGRPPSKRGASGCTPSKGGLLGIPPKFLANKT